MHVPVWDELTAMSKNSGLSWDEHILQRPTWEDEFHNGAQGVCLWADVRTVQEGFGSFSDAKKEDWLDDWIQQMTLTTQMAFSEKQRLQQSILSLSD